MIFGLVSTISKLNSDSAYHPPTLSFVSECKPRFPETSRFEFITIYPIKETEEAIYSFITGIMKNGQPVSKEVSRQKCLGTVSETSSFGG